MSQKIKLVAKYSILGLAFVLMISACGSKNLTTDPKNTSSPVATPTPSNPYGAAPIDPPGPNETVLRLQKGSKVLNFTLATLAKVGTSEITIEEPFVKETQSFTVIPLSKLFNLVGIVPTDKVSTKALNDYVYDNTAEKFLTARGYLAIKRDGQPIPYDQGGVIRIIFPNDSVWSHFLDPWNWSLDSITVK